MFEVSLHLVAALVFAAFFAGLIDAIAGGGGLITIPALLLAGASPIEAVATNKVQGSFGAATAAVAYARAGQVDPRRQIGSALVAFLAGAAGAVLAQHVPTGVFRMGLPVVLIGIALFFALKPGLSDADRVRRMTPALFGATIVPLVGLYDGLIGPGAGSFYMIGFVLLPGFGVLKATAHTKLLNLASNLGGLLLFALTGHPWWAVGLAMGAAQIAGARIGAGLAMKRGARAIKPLLVVTSTAMALRLIWQMWQG